MLPIPFANIWALLQAPNVMPGPTRMKAPVAALIPHPFGELPVAATVNPWTVKLAPLDA